MKYILLKLLFLFPFIINAQNNNLIVNAKSPNVMQSTNYIEHNDNSYIINAYNLTKNESRRASNRFVSSTIFSDSQVNLNSSFKRRINLDIFIDTTRIFPIGIYFQNLQNPEPIKPLGFIDGYLVTLTNKDTLTIYILISDNSIPMILEAQDQFHKFNPIEYWDYSTCGNSYYYLVIEPSQRIEFPIRKYEGNFKSKMRTKFILNGEYYYSNEIFCSMNPGMLNIPEFITSGSVSLKEYYFLNKEFTP